MKIKRLPLFVIPLLLIVSNAHAQTPGGPESPSWQTYTVHGEDFSMALPVLPAFHTTHEFLERTGKTHRVYSIGSYADGVVYVIYIYENPKPRQSLDSFLNRLEIPKSVLTDLSLDGFPGKERRLPERQDVSQFFATQDRFYYFMAFGAPVDDPRMTKFFLSLSLHKKKDSIEVVDGPGLPYEPPVTPESSNDETIKKLFVGREVDRKARLAMKPEPAYTESARQHAVVGTVVLKVIFSWDGHVTNIRTVSGLPYGLTERAVDAARKIKFIPAIKDGKYVSMWMQLEYNFNLY